MWVHGGRGPLVWAATAATLVLLASAVDCGRPAEQARQAEQAVHRSRQALRARDFQGAAVAAEEAVALDPERVDAWLDLGIASSGQQDWPRAVAAYRRALQLDPNQAKALNNLANVYFRQGRYEEAATWYGRALEVDPDYLLATFHYGWTLRQLNRLDEAERVFERCEQIAASDDRERQTHLDCHYYLGSIRFRQGDYRAAAAIMEEVLAVHPTHREARYILGMAYRKMGLLDDARRQLEIYRQMLQVMRTTPIPEPGDP